MKNLKTLIIIASSCLAIGCTPKPETKLIDDVKVVTENTTNEENHTKILASVLRKTWILKWNDRRSKALEQYQSLEVIDKEPDSKYVFLSDLRSKVLRKDLALHAQYGVLVQDILGQNKPDILATKDSIHLNTIVLIDQNYQSDDYIKVYVPSRKVDFWLPKKSAQISSTYADIATSSEINRVSAAADSVNFTELAQRLLEEAEGLSPEYTKLLKNL